MSETRRQVEHLIGKGMNVRQIAAALGISTQAVYKHLKKLGIDPPLRGAA